LEYFASNTLRTQILKAITNLGLRIGKDPKFVFALGPEMRSTGPVGNNATEAGMLNHGTRARGGCNKKLHEFLLLWR
jgi:hypothetical protein